MPSTYPFLKTTFFRGTLHGQIASIWKTRHENPGKVADFKRAIEDGKIALDVTQLRRVDLQKLMGLGITGFHIPEKPPRVVKPRPKEPEPDLRDADLPGVEKAPKRRLTAAAIIRAAEGFINIAEIAPL